MSRRHWGKVWMAAASVVVLAAGAAWGQYPTPEPSRLLIIREAGKPEHRCQIDQALPQADGRTVYLVHDLATGERMRVLDVRTRAPGAGPVVGQLISRISHAGDAGMTEALASAPAPILARVPTTAELAGKLPAEESPVRVQLARLRSAAAPSERERAAMTLSLSDARTAPEVVKAIMESAKYDSAASVRVCCVRCLYRLSPEVPDVVPVIAAAQADASDEVAHTAKKAMQEIAKKK